MAPFFLALINMTTTINNTSQPPNFGATSSKIVSNAIPPNASQRLSLAVLLAIAHDVIARVITHVYFTQRR